MGLLPASWACCRRHGLAEKTRACQAVTPGLVDRLGEADGRTGNNLRGAAARQNFKRGLVEREAIMATRYPQGLAHSAGTGAEEPFVGDAAPPPHQREAGRWFERADEDGACRSLRLADEIQAPVDAVGAIHIGVASRPGHHRDTRRRAPY